MDLDWALVKALLSLKTPRDLKLALTKVTDEMVQGTAVEAYAAIKRYVSEYGTIPPASVVPGLDKLPEEPAPEVDWVVQRLSRRYVFYKTREPLAKAEESREKGDVESLVRHLDEARREAMYSGGKMLLGNLFKSGDKVWEMYERAKGGEIGIPYPWPTVNAITMGLWPGTLTYFVARPGSGKCVDSETEIPCPVDGVYRPIREVVDRRLPVWTKNGKLVPVNPVHLKTGRKECLEVTFRSGKTIVATPEHPFMTLGTWKRTDELSIGEYVEAVQTMPPPTRTETVPGEIADLVAGLLADGGLSQGQITFSKSDPAIVERMRAATRFVGTDLKHYEYHPPHDWRVTRGRTGGKKDPAREVLEAWGIGRCLSKEKTIPDRVFGLDDESLARFVGFYWSCDGGIENEAVITLSSASRRLLVQMQRLLLRFGITSRLTSKPGKIGKKVYPAWRLTVHASCNGMFRDKIPLVGAKKEQLARVKDSTNPNVDNVPVTDWLKKRVHALTTDLPWRSGKMTAVGEMLGRRTAFDRSKLIRRKTVSKRLLAAFADVFQDDDLMAACDVHWDEIVSIEAVGERDVYDLHVPVLHSFVANDFLVHNTMLGVVLAFHVWQEGKRVLFISPEMSAAEIAERMFAMAAGVSYTNTVRGSLGDFGEQKLLSTIQNLSKQDGIDIIDDPRHLDGASIESAVTLSSPDLVIVDASYKLRIGKGDRYERAVSTVEWLWDLCKLFNVPVVAMSQMNRGAEQGKKQVVGQSSVAMTDVVNWDAHAVFAINQDSDMKHDKILSLKPIKLRRMGMFFDKDEIKLNWDLDTGLFTEIEDEGFKDEEFKEGSDVPF